MVIVQGVVFDFNTVSDGCLSHVGLRLGACTCLLLRGRLVFSEFEIKLLFSMASLRDDSGVTRIINMDRLLVKEHSRRGGVDQRMPIIWLRDLALQSRCFLGCFSIDPHSDRLIDSSLRFCVLKRRS